MSGKKTEVQIDASPEEKRKLFAGLAASGMVFGACARCTRPYGSRDGSELCPPCRGIAKDSKGDWTPAHTVRNMELDDCRPNPELRACAECAGLGVVGWQPFGPHGPRCSGCNGRGQIAEERKEP